MNRPQTAPASTPSPTPILAAADYARRAADVLAPALFAYIAGGAAAGRTARSNRAAFGRWAILPRLPGLAPPSLAGPATTALSLGGQPFRHPILLAPVAYQALVHPDKELATARAAQATDTRLILSTLATSPLEAVAAAGGPGHWFQLYLQPEIAGTLVLARRAREAGFAALVVTLDATIQVAGHAALRAGFVLPPECVPANLPAGSAGAAAAPAATGGSRVFDGLMRTAPRRADLEALLAAAGLPVWVKGVMSAEDALRLRDLGVSGLIVSNHGGRTLDGVAASLEVLPAIRAALGPDFPVLFDGGVRSGADAFKAMALGANAVLIGRLQLYALAAAGAVGVGHMLNLLREEFELCMAQAGCRELAAIGPDRLWAQTPFPADGAGPEDDAC